MTLSSKITHGIIAISLATLTACASNQDKLQGNINLPGWVLMPSVENGLAESACVPWSGHITIDREQATAMARNTLVRQIEVKSASMTKTHASKTDTTGGTNISASFETNARQIAEATLKGSKAIKGDLFTIDNKQQFCVMVTLDPQQTRQVFDKLVDSSGAQLKTDDEQVLYEQFRAMKGQQELENAL